jgi:hypothetical protein
VSQIYARDSGELMPARIFTVAQIERALKSQAGIQTAAARALQAETGKPCSRELVAQAVHRSKRLQDACAAAREFTVDMAEQIMVEALQNKDIVAAKFYLETLGKGRGFSKRLEMTGKDGRPLEIGVPAQVAEARQRNEQLIDDVASRAPGADDPAAAPRGNGAVVE